MDALSCMCWKVPFKSKKLYRGNSSGSLKPNPQQVVRPSSVLGVETKPSIKFLVLCSSILSVMVEETNLDLVVNVCIPARSSPCESSDHRRSKVGMSCSLFNFFVWVGRDEERRGIEKSDALWMEKSDSWRGPLLLLGVKGLELIRAIGGVWVKSSVWGDNALTVSPLHMCIYKNDIIT